jgi:hypothetical protein
MQYATQWVMIPGHGISTFHMSQGSTDYSIIHPDAGPTHPSASDPRLPPILNPLQAQSARRGQMARGLAITGLQDIGDLFWAPMAVADIDQGPDEGTDHVMQKPVPFDVDGDRVGITIAATRDVAPKDGPHRVLVLVHGGGKGAEISRPYEVPGRCIHRLDGQRPGYVPTESNLADRTEPAGIDRVPAVGPRYPAAGDR